MPHYAALFSDVFAKKKVENRGVRGERREGRKESESALRGNAKPKAKKRKEKGRERERKGKSKSVQLAPGRVWLCSRVKSVVKGNESKKTGSVCVSCTTESAQGNRVMGSPEQVVDVSLAHPLFSSCKCPFPSVPPAAPHEDSCFVSGGGRDME